MYAMRLMKKYNTHSKSSIIELRSPICIYKYKKLNI